jgi:type IV fimbrial biogenesis protein FimT
VIQPPSPRLLSERGLTLVETLSGLAVVSVTLGLATPGLEALRQRMELHGAAAQVETDVQFARSEAVARGRTVRMTMHESIGGSCYIVHTGPTVACSCGGATGASCGTGGEVLRSSSMPADGRVRIRSAVRSITFDPVKGTVTPTATLRVESRDGRALHQVVNLLGRVRTCSPGGKLPGEKTC